MINHAEITFKQAFKHILKSFAKGVGYVVKFIIILILFAIGMSIPAAAIKYLFWG